MFKSLYFKNKKELYLIFTFSIFFIIIHSFISRFHFHETDSSIVFYKLNLDSNDFFFSVKGHIEKTSAYVFYPIRMFVAILSDYLPFHPIRAALRISSTTTYPLLQGFLYGFNNSNIFEYFYRFSSLVNIIFLLTSIFLLYLSNKRLGDANILSFIFSYGLLFLYQVNSYSFHLGSTIWNLCSSCLMIFSMGCKGSKKRDIFMTISLLSGYPSLLFWIINIFRELFVRTENKLNIKNLFQNLKQIFSIYKNSSITFLSTLILFYPFGESLRGEFDIRGFFTPFSIFPLYESIDLVTYIIFSILFILIILSLVFFLNPSTRFSFRKLNLKNSETILNIFLFFLAIYLMIIFNKLEISTTRHMMFLLPYIFFIANYSAQCIKKLISKKIKIFNLNFLYYSLILSLFIASLYSSYFRLDPLKVYALPKKIIEFQINKTNNNSITELTGGMHLLYNDYTKYRATYDRVVPLRNLPISFSGVRLIVTQRPSDTFLNYDDDLKKGDFLMVDKSNTSSIKLLEDPFIVKNNTYFDSLNFDPDSRDKESNGYARPNNIYIYPVEIKNLK